MTTERIRIPARLAALAALAVAALTMAASCREPAADPLILSFTFAAANNAALTADVAGDVDQDLGVITVRLPSSVASYDPLVPTVAATSGCTVVGPPTDYSTAPTVVTVARDDGVQRSYLVDVGEALAPAAVDAVLFTEYYGGTGYDLGGDRNRWLELSNRSASAVDLAQYHLVKRARVGGVRAPALDQDVALRGTLAAGASLVLYASALKTSRFGLPGSVTSPDIISSDLTFNGIIDFDGDDGYQLVRDGVVLDALGPEGGYGAAYNWGREKRLLRKNAALPSATWNHLDWIGYGLNNNADDAASAGARTVALAPDRAALTFFAFEGLNEPSYGIIDETAKTVSIAVPQGTDLSSVVVSAGVEGAGAVVGATILVSGVTRVDFRVPVRVVAWAENSATNVGYDVTVVEAGTLEYTTTPYSFNGGIKAAKQNLPIGPSVYTFPANTYIEGVLTAKNVNYKYSSTYYDCFFIQDNEDGILVWSDVGIDAPLGSRLRVQVMQGLKNYTMPTIVEHGRISRVDALTYDIYYRTGNYYNVASTLGQVYLYSGAIQLGMADYNEGTFAGNLMFQSLDEFAKLVETGDTGSFYGPILISYNKWKMCLGSLEQFQP